MIYNEGQVEAARRGAVPSPFRRIAMTGSGAATRFLHHVAVGAGTSTVVRMAWLGSGFEEILRVPMLVFLIRMKVVNMRIEITAMKMKTRPVTANVKVSPSSTVRVEAYTARRLGHVAL